MRLNITAALNNGRLLAPFIFEGYANARLYEIYVERVLVPALRPGMVFVIDNASFHKSPKVVQLIEAVRCRVVFLPPHSPDLNPIEHHWSAIKNAIRRAAEICTNFYDAAVSILHKMCKC